MSARPGVTGLGETSIAGRRAASGKAKEKAKQIRRSGGSSSQDKQPGVSLAVAVARASLYFYLRLIFEQTGESFGHLFFLSAIIGDIVSY